MNDAAIAQLGAPHLKVCGFQLWVHGYAYPDATDGDAGWVRTTAHVGGHGASVWVSGVFLQVADFMRFRDELATAHSSLSGDATLAGHEPNLELRVTEWDRDGNCRVIVELTPDALLQMHRMAFAADQSHLPTLLRDCDSLVRRLTEARAERIDR